MEVNIVIGLAIREFMKEIHMDIVKYQEKSSKAMV